MEAPALMGMRRLNCAWPECEKPKVKRGYCETHYAAARRVGLFTTTPCFIEGCGRNVDSDGMCQMHYARYRAHSDPTKLLIAARGSQKKKCPIEGCNRDCFAKGYCEKHYRRLHEHGDPLKTLIPPKGEGKGWIDKDGYRAVSDGAGKWKREHRVIMERVLGRSLKPTEHVHHINGDRLDNRVENLIVLSASHHAKTTLHRCPNCDCPICKPTNSGTTKLGEL